MLTLKLGLETSEIIEVGCIDHKLIGGGGFNYTKIYV